MQTASNVKFNEADSQLEPQAEQLQQQLLASGLAIMQLSYSNTSDQRKYVKKGCDLRHTLTQVFANMPCDTCTQSQQ